jgi:hypothetical protein
MLLKQLIKKLQELDQSKEYEDLKKSFTDLLSELETSFNNIKEESKSITKTPANELNNQIFTLKPLDYHMDAFEIAKQAWKITDAHWVQFNKAAVTLERVYKELTNDTYNNVIVTPEKQMAIITVDNNNYYLHGEPLYFLNNAPIFNFTFKPDKKYNLYRKTEWNTEHTYYVEEIKDAYKAEPIYNGIEPKIYINDKLIDTRLTYYIGYADDNILLPIK